MVRTTARRVVDRLPGRMHRAVPAELRADLRRRTGLSVPGDLAHHPVAPAPAPGERTGPPDFAVLGAADAGARWWLSLVSDHPDVAPGHRSADAAHFFAPYGTARFGPADVAAFHAWFPRRPGRVIGFWAPDGLAHPWVPPLLARAAPRTQVLVLVRDPVERLLDGLAHTVADRAAHPGSWLSDAVDRGFYAEQLTRLVEVFPRDQVRVLQYERCVADPEHSLGRTYEFLGVDPAHPARRLEPPVPVAGRATGTLEPGTLDRLRSMYASDVAALCDLLPEFDRSLWPNFAP